MVFAAHEVVKQNNELMMTCKAYNGRVVTEWLADALSRCHPRASDPRMVCAFMCVCLDNLIHVCLMFASAQCLHACLCCACVCVHGLLLCLRESFDGNCILRNALARFFGLMERYPRFLILGVTLLVVD